MATINLTIGCRYDPANKVNNPDGTSHNEPVVIFYFHCDAQTAQIIDGMGVSKGLRAEGNSLVKKVKADKYKDFIYGNNVFPKIIGALEQYGYAYDMNSRDALAASVQQEIDNFANSGLQKKINNDVSEFLDRLLDAMEKNLNDPNFMAYFKSIGNIRKCNLNGDEIDKLVDFSIENKVLALTQWLNAGNQGSPYYIATKKQFKLAGYDVNPDATPMYLVIPNPDELTKRSASQVINDLGITDYDTNDKRKIDVSKLENDINYGQNNVRGFKLCPFPYYSINQCTESRQSNLKDYIAQHEHGDNIDTTVDKDAQTKMKSDIVAKIELENQNVISETAMCQNAKKYAENRGDKKLASIASRGSAADVISFLAANAESYLRNKAQRYASHTDDTRELLEALALKKMGLDVDNADRRIIAKASQLRNYNGKINKGLFYSVASDLENIYYILNGLAESTTANDMLKFVLDSCGISVEEFKNMPNTEQEAQEAVNNVRENFIRTFNKLLITH
jgi:hypothetical protein